MKTQSYKKGLAFVLSLAMVFTTLFGGFGFLGIKGAVGEVYAAGTVQRTTTLNLNGIGTTNSAIEGWAWNIATKVLTLSGINLSTTSAQGLVVPENTTIVLEGDNQIASTCDPNVDGSSGIYSYGELSIIGGADDTLTVTAGASTNSNNSEGMHIHSGNLTINGNVTATGGIGNSSIGIAVYDVNSTLSITGGTLRAIGDQGAFSSLGIFSMNDVTISGSNTRVELSGSYGLSCIKDFTISHGAKLTAAGIDTTKNWSCGIRVKENFTISDSETVVTTKGGNVTTGGISSGIYSDSLGVFTMNGGTLNATGGNASNGTSYGIYRIGNIAFNGGTTSAISGTATTSRAINATAETNAITFGAGPATMVTAPAGGGLSSDGKFIATVSGGAVAATSAIISPYIAPTISADAGLTSVAGLNDATPSGTGDTTASAIIWSLDAANSVSTVTSGEIVSATDSTVALYSDASFTTTTASIGLTVAAPKTAYIKVTAQNGTTIKYYAVTINRSLITVSGTKIYANGNRLTLVAGTTEGYTVVFNDKNYNYAIDAEEPIQTISAATGLNNASGYDLSTFDIYGGSNVAVVNAPNLFLCGGVVNNLYGGGDGRDTTGWVNVIVRGGNIKQNIYGGGTNSSASNVNISIRGGTISGDVRGGPADSGSVTGLRWIQVGGGTIRGTVSDYTDNLKIIFEETPVYKTILTLGGITAETLVTSGALSLTGVALGYDLTDVKTTATGGLTFYLPTGAAIAAYSSVNYATTIAANHNNVFTQLNASLAPVSASFDKRSGSVNNGNVVITKTDSNYTLTGIKNGATPLASGTVYTVSGSSVTINKSYLETLPTGTAILTFDYSGGMDPTLSIDISESTLPPKDIPAIAIDYTTEQLTGFIADEAYTVSGAAISPGAGNLAIDSAWMGHTINIVRKGDGTTSSDSTSQLLLIPARPTVTTATGHDPTTIGGTGSITGLDSTMEYGTNGTSWTPVAAGTTSIGGLTTGTYYVRVKATSTNFAGTNATVAIAPFGATKEATPVAIPDYPNEKLTGLTPSAIYIIEEAEYTADGSGNLSILASWLGNNNISIVKKGNDLTTTNSDPQSIGIAGRPATPTAGAFAVTQPSASGANGTIAGITALMQYTTDGGITWIDGTGSDLLKADGTTVGIRVKATGAAPCSLTFSISLAYTPASSGGGGGGGGSTPATTIINTNTGSVTGNQLSNAAAAAKDGGTVTIKADKTSEVTLLNSGLGSLAGKNNSLTVVTENGTLTFDSKAVGAIGTQAAATDIKVIVDDVVKTTLTEEQQTKVGDKTVYDLSVMSGGKLISSFNGGKVNVSIPYELKTGETAENLTVWYMADNGSLTEINCTYDAKTKAVTFVVDHFSKYIIGQDELAEWVNPFADVKSSAWYYNAVSFVNTNGLMKGQTDTAFGPQTSMTRGMFVTILGRMEDIDATVYASKNTFSDVKSNQYYAPYIAWATEKGIVSGMGGDKFAPNAAVTREQMAVMMTNYLKFKGQGPAGAWAIQLTYGDLDKVSSWADEAVMFMTMKDLMNGMGNDAKGNPMFAPKATSTRAQTAQVMMSLGELVK